MSTLPERTDVLVIGGGVIGTSTASHVAEAGISTVLLERGALGSGASGTTAGVIRTYFPGDPHTGDLAVRSVEAYHSFSDADGSRLDLERVGFLVLFTEEHQVEEFRRTQSAQQAAGVDVKLITRTEAAQLNPLLNEDTILAAAWSPDAYACDPAAIVRGYAATALKAGAMVCTDTPVAGIDPDGTVHTPAGSVRANTIVCAAGPWSRDVASMADVDLPVDTYPIELILTEKPPMQVTGLPMTLHASSGLRIRSWEDRILIGMGRPDQGESRQEWVQRLTRHLGTLYPAIDDIHVQHAWSGDFDGSPNGTAFIGRHPSRPFLYAAGFSGQGLCQAPAAGEIIRNLVAAD